MSTEPILVALPAPPEETVDLFDLTLRFLALWRRILVVAAVVLLLCMLAVYSIKPKFEAQASLLPQNKDDSSGVASYFSTRSPGDVLAALLASRSVADDVLDRTGLMQKFHMHSRDDARAMLGGSTTINAAGSLVTIVVRSADAQDAQHIANAYLDALQAQRERMNTRESEVHGAFFRQQIETESAALAAAEQDLKQTQESTGIVQPEAQTNLGLNAIAQVRSQIVTLQAQLAALRAGATDQNPQVRSLSSQIGQLQAQERAMQSGAEAGNGGQASTRLLPQLNLDLARKSRDVRYHEALLNSLSNQYENSRLREGNSEAAFVVVDRAVAPERKAWPPRRALFYVSLVLSLLAGCFAAALTILWRRLMADPAHVERMRALRHSFRRTPRRV